MNAPAPSAALRPAGADALLKRSKLAGLLRRHTQCEVLFDAASRARYATDASIYQIEPVGVAVPTSDADLVMALAIARDLSVPVLPRGGGTSQCGQTVGECLVLDASKHLNRVLNFDAEARRVTVEPGMVLDHLNAYLKPHGLWFPVDVSTSAQATLGGMAGNNSCGSRSIAYGNMVHNVAAIDAILADGSEEHFGPFGADATRKVSPRLGRMVSDLFSLGAREKGEIERVWPRVLRRVGGYNLDVFHPVSERPYTADNSVNLAHLLVGSEGTLALTRRITLDLSPLPRAKALGVVNFPTFYQAMDAAQHIVKLGPVAVELVDRTMIDLARANPAFRPVIDRALIGTPAAILLVEFAGADRGEQLSRLKQLVELMSDHGLPGSVVEMPDEGAQKALWEVRKAGLNIMMSMKGDGKPVSFIEDCAVPLEHLADYTARLTEVFHRHGTEGTWYAHASVGTLHVRPILDMRRSGNAGGAAKMRAIAQEASAMVREYKGAYSGEHGDGLCRGEWIEWQFGPRLNNAFREIKALFDPDNRMNPGKIIDPPRMDDASLFRFKPGHAVAPVSTALDWSGFDVTRNPLTGIETAPGTGHDPAQGLAKAVDMCNNNGHCRKFDAGTMCPSYRATRDEQHLTRGRANTLRQAMSGQLGQDGEGGIASRAVHEALKLCVSCKGCKRECPTGVDMAKMKIEHLHHYNRKHGLTLKDRLIANLPRYAPAASTFGWALNLRDTIPGLALLSEKLLGFSARRSLPRWTRPFRKMGSDTISEKMGSDPISVNDAKSVILWVDTFNNYFEPDNLTAAKAVLEAAGYKVAVSVPPGERPLCCGRTYLATGQVDTARAEARRTLEYLLPLIDKGAVVVGLEPSCLFSLRDEFLAMNLGAGAARLALEAFTFEEFIAREVDAGRFAARFNALPQERVLLHGHCHQKAFDAVAPIHKVLGLIPQLKVETIESSCCGMAGAFGYEREHYDVSMKMAELSLLPAVRAAGDDTLIVADGTSCRHQIHDGAAREALHVARVLAAALER
ncbi:MAG: FAD-binding protein [Burkholderiales bacterium]|nr:FAD-binding protein [Burkholderiales bacterium]